MMTREPGSPGCSVGVHDGGWCVVLPSSHTMPGWPPQMITRKYVRVLRGNEGSPVVRPLRSFMIPAALW